MNKPASIVFAVLGGLAFVVSAVRPELAREAVRFAGWQRRWR